jgi:molybdopterin-guanine dinucleotide biosynthesis protein A
MAPQAQELGAIVLAGGRSSRMGTPKALLDWHGATLLQRITGILARVADPVVVVHAAGQLLPELPGVRLVADRAPDGGPLEGIAAGMRALDGRSEVAFVSSTDVPLLHPRFVRGVVAALPGHDVALPVADGHHHPLGAAYRLSLLARVEQLLADGDPRPASLFAAVRVARLAPGDLPEPQSLRNLNTPQQYAAALAEPQPEIELRAEAAAAELLGFTHRAVRAATLSTLLHDTPGLGDLLTGARLTLNGRPLTDPSTPLVEGDVVSAGARR